jgi:3-deoxy-D-manno-octulosonic-acid transferase
MLLLLFKPTYLAVFLYNIFMLLFRAGIGISSLWNIKAKKWTRGRKDIFEKIRIAVGDPGSGIIWIHCSSLGEFEQGRPIIEKIRRPGKNDKVLITFFSPSGYEAQQDYSGADYIFYLPADSKKNAQLFLTLIDPSLVIFVKYDLWYHYLKETKKRNIPCLLVSAVFRKEQAFFKSYGSLHKKMLVCFNWIFVQNEESKKLLATINITSCSVSGDTRFDRVIEIAEQFQPIAAIEQFVHSKKCIVAGSTWMDDEQILQTFFIKDSARDLKLIIAPHEIHQHRLQELARLFPGSIFFSEIKNDDQLVHARVLIIDSIGLLSRL